MVVTLTVRLMAESKQELASTFPAQVKKYVEHMETLKAEGKFGAVKDVDIRCIVIGGMWKGSDGKAQKEKT